MRILSLIAVLALSPLLYGQQQVAISTNNSGLPVNLLSVVQKTNNVSSGSVASLVKAYASSPLAGNSLVVSFCNGNNNAPTAPISDTLSSTWAKAVHVVNGSAFECDIWYAVGITGGADTITVTPGGGNASIGMEIYEISGLIAWSVAQGDLISSATGTSATAAAPTVTPEASNSIAIGTLGIGTGAQTATVGTGWTNDSGQQNPSTPAGLFSFVGFSQLADDIQPLVPSATFTSEPWAIASVVFHAPMLPIVGSVQAFGSGQQNTSDAAWTSSTSQNTAVTLVSGTAAYNSILVTLVQGTTLTVGAVTFEASTDNVTWIGVQGVTIGTTVIMGPTYALVASTNTAFLFPLNAPYFRVRLSTAITGSATVTIQHATQSFPAVGLLAGSETLATGTNTIGSVKITDGTTVPGVIVGTTALKTDISSIAGTAPTAATPGVLDVNIKNIANTAPTVKAASTASVATDTSLVVEQAPNGGNPCMNPSATLAMVAGATSGTSAVQLIALSGSTKIYVCGATVQGISGSATPTFSLKYGTGTACATSGVTIIGAFTLAANVTTNWPGPAFVTTGGQELCYIQTGTSPVYNYAITYVQQ